MATCTKINGICDNRRYTIYNSNFIISFLNYSTSNKRINRFADFLTLFKKFFEMIRFCCITNKSYCSRLLYRKELNGSIYRKVVYLKKLKQQIYGRLYNDYKKTIRREINNQFVIRDVDPTTLNHLKRKADKYTTIHKKRLVEKEDLSLFLVALDEMKTHPNYKFLLVTDDTSLYDFINYRKGKPELNLNGTVYNNLDVIPLTSISYMTRIFICCNFDEIEEFDKFLFRNEIKITNETMRDRKLMAHYVWNQKRLPEVKAKKSQNCGVA